MLLNQWKKERKPYHDVFEKIKAIRIVIKNMDNDSSWNVETIFEAICNY